MASCAYVTTKNDDVVGEVTSLARPVLESAITKIQNILSEYLKSRGDGQEQGANEEGTEDDMPRAATIAFILSMMADVVRSEQVRMVAMLDACIAGHRRRCEEALRDMERLEKETQETKARCDKLKSESERLTASANACVSKRDAVEKEAQACHMSCSILQNRLADSRKIKDTLCKDIAKHKKEHAHMGACLQTWQKKMDEKSRRIADITEMTREIDARVTAKQHELFVKRNALMELEDYDGLINTLVSALRLKIDPPRTMDVLVA